MYDARRDTLAYFKRRSFFQKLSVGDTPTKDVVAALNGYFGTSPGLAKVEASACKFYLLNHVTGVLMQQYEPHEPLGQMVKVMKLYLDEVATQAPRLYYYTLLACTRETRHLKSATALMSKMTQKFGPEYMQFRAQLPSSSDAAANYLRKNPPPMPIAKYCEAMMTIFDTDGHWGGGYGGKPWGRIAEAVWKVSSGQTTMEQFMDTAWTLAHNNGPMFNKGMLYHHYGNSIYKILDVQRAGMMPQLIAEWRMNQIKLENMESSVATLHEQLKALMGESLDGYVRWDLVEARGSLHKYPDEKKKMKQLHPESWAAEAALAKELAEKEAQKLYIGNGPEDYVIKTQRKIAA